MRHTTGLGLAAVIAAGLGLATTADAAPFSPLPLPDQGGATIERVDYECGPGWHLNPWGHCRPNRPQGWGYRGGWGYGPPPPPPPQRYGFYGPRPFY